jgi:Uma2 family endonuclease
MQAAHPFAPAELLRAVQGRIVLRNLRWQDYEALLEAREKSWPRIIYLDGEIELMAPTSLDHEFIKTTVARLVEAYAEEFDLPLNGAGSATLKRRLAQAGAEADECYFFGPKRRIPQLAVEVAWSRGALNKLEVYRRLGVEEVWIWSKGELEIHVLRGSRYVRSKKSELLPELDLDWLLEFVDVDDQTGAVKRWRKALRSSKRRGRRG